MEQKKRDGEKKAQLHSHLHQHHGQIHGFINTRHSLATVISVVIGAVDSFFF